MTYDEDPASSLRLVRVGRPWWQKEQKNNHNQRAATHHPPWLLSESSDRRDDEDYDYHLATHLPPIVVLFMHVRGCGLLCIAVAACVARRAAAHLPSISHHTLLVHTYGRPEQSAVHLGLFDTGFSLHRHSLAHHFASSLAQPATSQHQEQTNRRFLADYRS